MARTAVNSPDYDVPIKGFAHIVEAPANGRMLFVSGLTSRDADGTIVALGDIAGQTRQVLERMRAVLATAGASLDDVVQIHTFVRDIESWPAIEAVWRDFWSEPWPASTYVEVSRLYDDRQLIEMEAVAVVPAGDGS